MSALEALRAAKRLFDEALPKFNWGASFLDANAIQLLNEVPGQVARAIEASAWLPVTPELLTRIDAGDLKGGMTASAFDNELCFWVNAPTWAPEPVRGIYEWRQGHNPHGFKTDSWGYIPASHVTHLMPYFTPERPAA